MRDKPHLVATISKMLNTETPNTPSTFYDLGRRQQLYIIIFGLVISLSLLFSGYAYSVQADTPAATPAPTSRITLTDTQSVVSTNFDFKDARLGATITYETYVVNQGTTPISKLAFASSNVSGDEAGLINMEVLNIKGNTPTTVYTGPGVGTATNILTEPLQPGQSADIQIAQSFGYASTARYAGKFNGAGTLRYTFAAGH